MLEYYRDIMNTISDSLESLNVEVYEKLIDDCVNVIKNGGKIVASGLGKNVPICEKFVGTMNSLGLDASFLHTNTAVHGDLGIVKKNDLVLLLSKSGNTIESVMLANYLMERGTETWLISFSEESKLISILEHKLLLRLKNEGDKWDIVPNNSTSLYLIILQGIAMEISDRLGITLDDFRINHPGGGIGDKLRRMK